MKNSRLILLLIEYLIDKFDEPDAIVLGQSKSTLSVQPTKESFMSQDDLWKSLDIDADQFGQANFSLETSKVNNKKNTDVFPSRLSSPAKIHSTKIKRPLKLISASNTQNRFMTKPQKPNKRFE